MVSESSFPPPSRGVALTPPRRFSDEITAVLLDRVRAGVYPAGTKLPSTRQLAEDFSVSQPIVREALSRLKHDGYIEPRQGSGVYVRSHTATHSLRLDLEDPAMRNMLADTFEMRLHMEQSCAELAAARRRDEDLVLLETHLSAMAQAVQEGKDGTEHDVQFHLAIAGATQNQALWQLANFLHGTLSDVVSTARANSGRTPGQPEQAQKEHEAIYRAILERDPITAGQAIRRHLERAAQRLRLKFSGTETD